MLTNILEQIRNRAYAPSPWDEVLGNPAFAEWPLKEYGQRLKAYRENLQNIKQPETSWGQRAWQALGRLFPQYSGNILNTLKTSKTNTAAAPINVSNHQNTYWKMAAQGTISDDLKRKVDKLVSYLIAYYQTHGQDHKINTLRNNPLELTSVKIRPVDEQTGYIFDEFTNKIKNPTNGSYVNLRKELSSYYSTNKIETNLNTAHQYFLNTYRGEEGLKNEYYDRELYHVKGNAVDIRINNPFTKDIETLFTNDLMDPNIERNWFNGVVSLAKIHEVGKGLHLHISFE